MKDALSKPQIKIVSVAYLAYCQRVEPELLFEKTTGSIDGHPMLE